jgi:peptidoglycan hydrolase-like protein with peptidoglycan-binding domain
MMNALKIFKASLFLLAVLCAVVPAANPSFANERAANDTLVLQQALTLLGYDVGRVDGRMGPRTISALAQYQRERGLATTGRLDARTVTRLTDDLLSDDPTPSSSQHRYLDNPAWSDPPAVSGPPVVRGRDGEYLGNLSNNEFDPNSTSNPFGQYGSPYGSQSINNPYSTYGSPYSSDGVRNSYTSGGPRLYGRDGTYLGRLNSNPYDPESVSNPYGTYGSPYSPNSINNPYGRYGSPYSTLSPNNPYLSGFGDDD